MEANDRERSPDERGEDRAVPPASPGAPNGDAKKRRRRRRHQQNGSAGPPPPRPAGVPDGLVHAVREAMESLRWTSVALARSRGLEHKIDGIELRLRIRRGASAEELADRFLGELLARLDEAQFDEEWVVPNHAYCFRCESFLCAHSRPGEPRAVLSGYEPTGRPRWTDLVSLLIERRDPRAEGLADRSAGIVAIPIDGAEVLAGRLEAFGGAKPDVDVLCQVWAGPFPLRSAAAPGEEEGALTIQFLRVRGRGRERLVLHPIGDGRLLDPARGAGDPDLHRILGSARAALAVKRPGGRDGADPNHGFARSIANDLARDLEHHYRVRARRTQHAIERSRIGARPTSNAFPEARSADDASIRVDRDTGTFVLLGKNSRVHFFNGAGRHVTSVRFAGEAIRARVDSGRWRAADAAEIANFRSQVNGHGPARRGNAG